MLVFYMDDSADGKRERVFVVAGFLAKSEDWFEVERHWDRAVKEAGLEYFRTTECYNLTGEFFKLLVKHGRVRAREISDELLLELKSIVKASELLACCLLGSMPAYNAVRSEPYGPFVYPKDPYINAHEEIIFQVAKTICKHLGPEPIAFVFDEHNKAAALQGRWAQFKEDHPSVSKCMGTLASLDDRLSPAIQMGDLIANTAKRAYETRVNNPNAGLAELKEWAPRIGWIAQWNEEYLRAIMEASIDVATTPKFSFEFNG